MAADASAARIRAGGSLRGKAKVSGMHRERVTFGLLALMALGGCETKAPEAPPLEPARMAGEAISLYDKNINGTLEGKELETSPALKAALDKYDADHDGKLTASEIERRVQYYADRLGNLTVVFGQVMLDDSPLQGASVTLVSEPWLGRPSVTAQTNDKGEFVFRMEGADEAGVHAGLYRVEIAKKDGSGAEAVPDKYNTKTTLGQEAAPDRRELESGVRLELKTQ